MRIPHLFAVVLVIGALVVTTRSGQATQQNGNTFRSLIEALNAEDAVGVQAHLADDFSLTFVGGTTVSGTEAQHLLLLLDTPITVLSVTPGGMQNGAAQIDFGRKPPTMTIDAPTTPDAVGTP